MTQIQRRTGSRAGEADRDAIRCRELGDRRHAHRLPGRWALVETPRQAVLGGLIWPPGLDRPVANCPGFDSDPAAKPSFDFGTDARVVSTEPHDYNAFARIQPNHRNRILVADPDDFILESAEGAATLRRTTAVSAGIVVRPIGCHVSSVARELGSSQRIAAVLGDSLRD